MLFIYLLEEHQIHGPRIEAILRRMSERGDLLCTSSLTLGEVLVAPYRSHQEERVVMAEALFRDPHLKVLSFTPNTARIYASIRATHRVAPADAIHLACASEAGVDLFLTNDRTLIGRSVPGVKFIGGLNTDVF